MEIDLKEDFVIREEGTSYEIPVYRVEENVGLVKTENFSAAIDFVRGSKLGDENVESKTGILHEHLISVMIHDLKFKNNLVPSRETSLMITKLEEALMWARQRQIDRVKRSTQGTYKK